MLLLRRSTRSRGVIEIMYESIGKYPSFNLKSPVGVLYAHTFSPCHMKGELFLQLSIK